MGHCRLVVNTMQLPLDFTAPQSGSQQPNLKPNFKLKRRLPVMTWGAIAAQATVGFTGLSLLSSRPAIAQTAPQAIAQLFYPAPNAQPTIQVLGQGEASAIAQEGVLTLKFDKVYGEEYAINEETGEYDYSQPLAPESVELSEAMFAPIVNAWKRDFGLADNAIAVTLLEGTATVTATVSNPKQALFKRMSEQAMSTMGENNKVTFNSLDVKYRITNCQPLQIQAYRNAIADSKTRATTLAEAMGATLAGLPSVAESPFNLIAPPSCNEEASLFDFANFAGMFSGAQAVEKDAEVTIRRDIFVTYPIK
jgi:uncharacterized protein YggE